jgi:hypothetical protein
LQLRTSVVTPLIASQCDKKVPACGQCIKTGRGCSGDRKTVDLMFYDESTRVVTQNQGRRASSSSISNIQENSKVVVRRASSHIGSTTPFKLTGFVMWQPLDDLGVNYFMSNFTVADPTMTLLLYLSGFYAKTGFANPALSQMVAAVGLVGLARRSRCKDMRNVAANNHGAAIRTINAALVNPKYAVQDSILASIYLAAMFDAIIVGRTVGMDNACTHLAGAVSVGLLILKQEKRTEVTFNQCTTLVKTVIMNCWIQQVPLQPGSVKFKKLVEQKVNIHSLYDKFLDIVMELVRLKETLRDESNSNPWTSYREPWPSTLTWRTLHTNWSTSTGSNRKSLRHRPSLLYRKLDANIGLERHPHFAPKST